MPYAPPVPAWPTSGRSRKSSAISPRGRSKSTLQGFLETGEDRALSRLLQVCAFNEVKLDPEVLCACIGVCEDILDSAPCFALQDEHAIEPLLRAATAEALPFERQSYAAGLAAELTVKLGLDPQPVRKVLWKLEHATRAPEVQLLLAQSLRLLDEGQNPEQAPVPLWSAFELSDLLPEHRPRTVVGGTYTVRRPVAKLGRNDPCHCGSGKKYKKCCYAKDQELLRDASQYAGTTRTDLKAKPGLVDDPNVVLDMRAHELKQLSPAALSEGQLHSGYQRALAFGLRELAFEMLLEWERRATEEAFDPGHFEDLIEDVLQAGDLDLARRIRDHCGDQAWWRPQAIAFRFDLLEHPERFEPLERDCRAAVCEVSDEEIELDEPLTRLAYDFAPRHPALAIAFARAAIASHPDRLFDNDMLLDVIRDARVDLDLAAGWRSGGGAVRLDRGARPAQEEGTGRERGDRAACRSAGCHPCGPGREETGAAGDRGSARGGRRGAGEGPRRRSGRSARDRCVSDLRCREGGNAAALARPGRGPEGRDRCAAGGTPAAAQAARRRAQEARGPRRSRVRRRRVPVPPRRPRSWNPRAGRYCRSIRMPSASVWRSLAPPLAAKAILAAGRFAAHDEAIWRHTKPLERLPEHYRIRLGLDYRLIVHWQPGKVLEIVDVIPRQDLESWIRRQG